MSGISRPYHRTIRPRMDGTYGFASDGFDYVRHPRYAENAQLFIRHFYLIQERIEELFSFVEPADENMCTFSLKNHSLIVEICVDCESNWKAILRENGYSKPGNWNRSDYRKIEWSHKLSQYLVRFPNWRGIFGQRQPFLPWSDVNNTKLNWYDAYNSIKHDKSSNFRNATFENVIDAFSALVITISSQFGTDDFSLKTPELEAIVLTENPPESSFVPAIGERLEIAFPKTWKPEERYNLNLSAMQAQSDPFQDFRF